MMRNRFYVYQLQDPRDLSVFYIGKGTAARATAHTHKIPKADMDGDTPKAKRIREILECGEEVISTIIKKFNDEQEAYDFERRTIEKLGFENLTNSNRGGGGDKTKLTTKQEKFVEAFSAHGNATRAAKDAGYSEKTAHSIGDENLRKPAIARAIEERQKQFRDDMRVTRESITAELNENRELALETMQVGAANQATLGKAKLHGLMTEKHEVTGKDGKDLMSTEEVGRRVAFILQKAIHSSQTAAPSDDDEESQEG